jgi:hypothetical protein
MIKEIQRWCIKRTEGSLDDTDLGSGGVQSGESAPIVDDQSGTDHV